MNRTDILRELIIKAIGDESGRLDAYLDLYAEAVKLDAAETADFSCSSLRGGEVVAETETEVKKTETETEIKKTETETEVKKTKRTGKSGVGDAGRAAIAEYRALKVDAYSRLCAYRSEHGPGCFAEIVKASRGTLYESDVRDMYEANKVKTEKWRALDVALRKLETAEKTEEVEEAETHE